MPIDGARSGASGAAIALALGIGDLAGVLHAGGGDREPLRPRRPDAGARARGGERRADARRRSPTVFAIIALGKLGGRELNYSSDVDLLYLYDPETLAAKAARGAGPGGAAHRPAGHRNPAEADRGRLCLPGRSAAAAVARSHSDRAAGRRGDLLLRNARLCPGSGRRSSGRGLRRAMRELGRYFLDAIHPFVWRRSLDFGAIGEIRSISRQIRDHYAQGQAFGPGYDVKRGRGGIREVEFFAQIHQLIHGGREPALRAPATLDALAALAEAGRIDPAEAAALAEAYRMLRTIEHRLQMVDDRQTHSLPEAKRSTRSPGCTALRTARRCSTCFARMSSGSRRSTTRSRRRTATACPKARRRWSEALARPASRSRGRRGRGSRAGARARCARCAPTRRARRSRRCCPS